MSVKNDLGENVICPLPDPLPQSRSVFLYEPLAGEGNF